MFPKSGSNSISFEVAFQVLPFQTKPPQNINSRPVLLLLVQVNLAIHLNLFNAE